MKRLKELQPVEQKFIKTVRLTDYERKKPKRSLSSLNVRAAFLFNLASMTNAPLVSMLTSPCLSQAEPDEDALKYRTRQIYLSSPLPDLAFPFRLQKSCSLFVLIGGVIFLGARCIKGWVGEA